MKHLLSLSLIFFYHVLALGKDWVLDDVSKGWNSPELVVLYFHNSEIQTQWALEALSHYSFRGNEQILDFGSGDGKFSALMSFRVPKGKVLGVDISKEMIAFSQKMFPSARYKNLIFSPLSDVDFSTNTFPTKFDLVTAFCVFQLTPNPQKVLQNLKSHMHVGSKLIATFPISGNEEFYKATAEMVAKKGWDLPKPSPDSRMLQDPAKIAEIFEKAGFLIEHFQVIQTRNPFSTKEEMITWLESSASASWHIPPSDRRDFFRGWVDLYLKYRPQDKDPDGFVYLNLSRVDLIVSLQKG